VGLEHSLKAYQAILYFCARCETIEVSQSAPKEQTAFQVVCPRARQIKVRVSAGKMAMNVNVAWISLNLYHVWKSSSSPHILLSDWFVECDIFWKVLPCSCHFYSHARRLTWWLYFENGSVHLILCSWYNPKVEPSMWNGRGYMSSILKVWLRMESSRWCV
jgi:hypothetical protein